MDKSILIKSRKFHDINFIVYIYIVLMSVVGCHKLDSSFFHEEVCRVRKHVVDLSGALSDDLSYR